MLRLPVLVGPGRAGVDEQQGLGGVDAVGGPEAGREGIECRRQLEHEAGFVSRDAERREDAEIAAHLVRIGDIRGVLGHEELVELVPLVDADAARGAAHAGQQAGQEEVLYVEGNIEMMSGQELAGFAESSFGREEMPAGNGAVKGRAIPYKQLIDIGVAAQELTGGRTDQPGQMGRRTAALQAAGHGRRVQDVANRAQPDDEETRMIKVHEEAIFLKGFTLLPIHGTIKGYEI